MISFDADKLTITSAPAIEAMEDGGQGVHKSSHISTPIFTLSISTSNFVDSGTEWNDPIETLVLTSIPVFLQRFS